MKQQQEVIKKNKQEINKKTKAKRTKKGLTNQEQKPQKPAENSALSNITSLLFNPNHFLHQKTPACPKSVCFHHPEARTGLLLCKKGIPAEK